MQIATGKMSMRLPCAVCADLCRCRWGTVGGTPNGARRDEKLIGPYKKVDEARAAVSKVAKSGGDAFVWQSEAGEEVAKIGGK